MSGSPFQQEIEAGDRFGFGENWRTFLSVIDADRVHEAEASLSGWLETADLRGRSFLDVGSGSGLFSLAAARLGARVHSFDYDPASVGCALELRDRFRIPSSAWTIERASVLDVDYVRSLGTFDIVYAWGVLHHTGAMWTAIENLTQAVAPGGRLYVSIYNDQGLRSRLWHRVKVAYCSGSLGRAAVIAVFFPYFVMYGLVGDLVRLRNPWTRYIEYKRRRGMSMTHDWFDWLGGLPFEVASPGDVVDFMRPLGFAATRLRTVGAALGCNEFIFNRIQTASTPSA